MQMKRRVVGYLGMTKEAARYAERYNHMLRSRRLGREYLEKRESEARKNITLPTLKWMERPLP